MAAIQERVGILETKVDGINDKIDDVKEDIKSLSATLDKSHEALVTTLKEMRDESTAQHSELAGKVKALEGIKDKWMRLALVGLAFAAGAGWLGNGNLANITKFLGL